MLKLNNVQAGYRNSQVLNGVDLNLDPGEVVTLLGRNGMGKTTTVKCICGLLAIDAGAIEFNANRIHRLMSYQIARLGVGLVPEGRQIFANLNVRENLLVAARIDAETPNPWNLRRIYKLFPRLEERAQHGGHQLSGGEQQMLAIGRALMINPQLLILDEATEGLAPLIREEIWQVIRELKTQGLSILIIDKNLATLLQIADRYYVMEKGRIVADGAAAKLADDADLQARYLGV